MWASVLVCVQVWECVGRCASVCAGVLVYVAGVQVCGQVC